MDKVVDYCKNLQKEVFSTLLKTIMKYLLIYF